MLLLLFIPLEAVFSFFALSRAHPRDLRSPKWLAWFSSCSMLASPCGLVLSPMGPPRMLLQARFRPAYSIPITTTPPPLRLNPSPSSLIRCSYVYARFFNERLSVMIHIYSTRYILLGSPTRTTYPRCVMSRSACLGMSHRSCVA